MGAENSAAVTSAGTYWPPGVLAASTLDAHLGAFASLGYEVCEASTFEVGYEKVAIYTLPNGRPAHAARQLVPDKWTSKVGAAEDIEHDAPERLIGLQYGTPAVFLRRPAAGTDGD